MVTVIETNADGCEGEAQQIEVDCNLSSESYAVVSPKIYPNPARDRFTIETATGQVRVELYDATGKVVMEGWVNHQQTFKIDHLQKGVFYGVLNYSNGNRHAFKLVKVVD